MKVFSSRVAQLLLLVVVVTLASPLAFCLWFRVGSANEWQIYQAMDEECHPIWKDLYYGRIRAGDDVDSVIAIAPPSVQRGKGQSGTLSYYQNYKPGDLHFTSVTLKFRDGKLVDAYAGSCTWVRQFSTSPGKTTKISACSPTRSSRKGEPFLPTSAWRLFPARLAAN
ncbi:hypothetical protein [Lacipirellula sp.]|uniref:hypothetical protein n=1 Tax=Lacipirellula sp. TaxID=2691419 RepID=UPI003D1093F2